MEVHVQPGRYVVAVSGGVDSVVLLDLLSRHPDLVLAVAHFDHGIREESADDAQFVAALAQQYGLPFYSDRAELGPDASEATARKYRYTFLRQVVQEFCADAIVTAHHHDDVIETALLNILRGTQRKGVVSLRSSADIVRPLLSFSKAETIRYAQDHSLSWREDSTNQDTRYRRNQIRQIIQKQLNNEVRSDIATALAHIQSQDEEIDFMIKLILDQQPDRQLKRALLRAADQVATDDSVAKELLAGWLRRYKVPFDKKTILRILDGVQTLPNTSQIDVQGNYYCVLNRQYVVLKHRDSV